MLVPLCGKSLDMLWLHQQGLRVLGVEFSRIAVEAFFIENQLPYLEQVHSNFVEFAGEGQAQGLNVLVGDFFCLNPQNCADISVVYDRAALVALPEDMRHKYARHLARLMPENSAGLLISMNYDPSKMRGPPFPVPDENVHELLQEAFTIDELAKFEGPEFRGNLAERGLETLEERIYRLQRRTVASAD